MPAGDSGGANVTIFRYDVINQRPLELYPHNFYEGNLGFFFLDTILIETEV